MRFFQITAVLIFLGVSLVLFKWKSSPSEHDQVAQYEKEPVVIESKTAKTRDKSAIRSVEDMQKQFADAESHIALQKLFERFYAIDPEAALSAWARFQSPIFDNNLTALSLFLNDKLGKDLSPFEAMELMREVKEKKFEHYEIVSVNLLRGYSSDEAPEDLVKFFNQAENKNISELSAGGVGLSIGFYDPEEYLSSIEKIENPVVYQRIVAGLLRAWVESDPVAVSEYLNSVEQTPLFEESIAELAENTAITDPEVAMTWAESIDDSDMRHQTIRFIAQRWSEEDSEELSAKYAVWRDSIEDPVLKQEILKYKAP